MGADGQSATPLPHSPLQRGISSNHNNRSGQTTYTKGNSSKENYNAQHSQTKNLRSNQQRAVSSELGDLSAPGETKTKTQMARAFEESQELYKTAHEKAGLQTVKTRRVLKKTTTITRGENEKVSPSPMASCCCCCCFFHLFYFLTKT